jgi:hypothetical protein
MRNVLTGSSPGRHESLGIRTRIGVSPESEGRLPSLIEPARSMRFANRFV